MSSTPIVLTNGIIVMPDHVISEGALIIDDATIVAVGGDLELPAGVEYIDVGGRLVCPGLIDIHTHGAVGHTFNEPTAEAFAAITTENAFHGITSLLATTATAPLDDLIACLEFAQMWMGQEKRGAHVLGAHVEGPYFCLEQAGAQDPSNLRLPNDGSVDQLLAYRDIIRIMTFAPELPGAVDLAARLQGLGIVAAAGHSAATEEDFVLVKDAGVSHIIHIWSGQSTTIREGPWRRPGLLEVSLTDPDLTVEMIADGKHLPPTLMKLAYSTIGPDRLCLISDATSGAGLLEGERFRMGEMEYEVHDGVGMLLDRTAFAGSTTLLNKMVPIVMDAVGLSLSDAVRMASQTPARVIGVDDRKGSIDVGKDADIAIFDDDFTPWRTMIGGRWVS